MDEIDELKLREENYHEMYKITPSWWAVRGIFFVFGFIFILLALSYFIKYPEIILAEAKFVSDIPSVTILSKIDSKIISIIKTDGNIVNKDDYIIVLLDNCNYKDIVALKIRLEKLDIDNNLIEFFENTINYKYKLGPHIQGNWNNLMTNLLEYWLIVKQKKYDIEIGRLTNQLLLQQTISNNFKKILFLNRSIDQIAENKKNIDSSLLTKEVISKKEYNDNLRYYYDTKKNLVGEELSYERGNLEIVKIVNSIDQLNQLKKDKLIELDINLKKAVQDLEISINTWEENYVIKSPIYGSLHFLLPLKENLHVIPGEELIMITPDSMKFTANLRIPFIGAGKIKIGQKVHIKLNDYPYSEYGIVTGKLEKLSNVANTDYYLGNVKLDNGSKTDYKKEITIKENTTGVAEIIVEDRSWLGRLFEKLVYVLKQ